MYMGEERRAPLGGIEKKTYIDSGGHPLTYDLMAGLRADVCSEVVKVRKDTKYLKENSARYCHDCRAELNGKYVKKAFGKWPVSTVEFIMYLLIIGILIGSAIIDPKELLRHFIKF